MRKLWIITGIVLLLTGCGQEQTFETVGDMDMKPVLQQVGQLRLEVPQGATALESESGVLYLCGDYSLATQVLQAGNLNATVQTMTGYSTEDLTVMETAVGALRRYEWVWLAAGEGGDVICRGLILDDGVYHYCVTLSHSPRHSQEMQQVWAEITDSCSIS